MWLSRRVLLGGRASSDVGSEVIEVVSIAEGRLLVRLTVTEDGMLPAARGELRGVLCGGGSFERAEWTRSSIFFMRLRSVFIW